jgi:hypothetical protein
LGKVQNVAKAGEGILVASAEDGNIKTWDLKLRSCACGDGGKLKCHCENESEYKVSETNNGAIFCKLVPRDPNEKGIKHEDGFGIQIAVVFLIALVLIFFIMIFYKRKKRRDSALIKKSDFLA